MKYPKVNKSNFNKISERLSTGKIKAPSNSKEFEEATKNMYGVKLTVDCLAYPKGALGDRYSCKYKINEKQNDYKKGEIYQLWEEKYSQYDGLKVLLDLTFGELSCGGVAGSHYGQTRCDKKTCERVKKWDGNNDLKQLVEAKKQHDSLVDIFGYNPFKG